MAYTLTAPSSGNSAMRPKNRVWGSSRSDRSLPLENRLRCPVPCRKSRPTSTIFTPGIPQWPSRDPIGERGGVNLYGFVGNDGIGLVDLLGQALVPYVVGSAVVAKRTLAETAAEWDKITPGDGAKVELTDGGLWWFSFKDLSTKPHRQRIGVIAKCDGCKLVLAGEMTGHITLITDYLGRKPPNGNASPAEIKAFEEKEVLRFSGIEKHERKHESIEAEHWNKVVSNFGKYDGYVFKKSGCCESWASYINSHAWYYEALADVEHENWDIEDYHKSRENLEKAQKRLVELYPTVRNINPYDGDECDEDRPLSLGASVSPR